MKAYRLILALLLFSSLACNYTKYAGVGLGGQPDLTTSAGQLHIFEELWNTVDQNYVYLDFNGVDWKQVGQEYRARIQAGLSAADFYPTMDEMVQRLGDEHSHYLSPQQAKEEDASFAGSVDFVGIGILYGYIEARQRVVVMQILPGGPAAEAGLQEHDVILTVDGQPAVDASGQPQVARLVRGQPGTTIQVSVQRQGQPPQTVNITRRQVNSQIQVPYRRYTTQHGKQIGYIYIPTFTDGEVGNRAGDSIRALAAAGELDGLVIDVRVNEGGNVDALLETLRYFVGGTIGYQVSRTSKRTLTVQAMDINGSQRLPLVVLTGPTTQSAAENLAGTLKDMRKAYLVGETTAGNLELNYSYDLSDGSRAWIAGATFNPVMHPDQGWEGTGVVVDEVVPTTWDDIDANHDPAIEAALRFFDSR